jgi:hypothetical protein
MFVKVVNKPRPNQALIAWKNSRPTEQKAKFDRMIDLDLPVNEFTRVNLFIESTLIEREIIATMRNHVMWAQGSRVQDCLEFEIDYRTNPHFEQHHKHYELVRSNMRQQANSGVRQDDYRLELPIVSNTRYSISTDFRTIIKLAKYFSNLKYQCPIFSEQFQKFSNELFFAAMTVLGKAGQQNRAQYIFSKYKAFDFLNKDFISPIISGKLGSMISVSAKVPFHLRAHIIRHRGIWVKDNLLEIIKRDDIATLPMTVSMNVQISGSESEMLEVVSKRSCWIANYSVWGGLLSKIEDNLSPESNPLPCKDGVCPWNADAMLRVEGNDPNPPCPIHMKLNKITPTDAQIVSMGKMIVDDKRSQKLWNKAIKESRQ